MQNEAYYDLDRKAAEISALDEYEYLTGEEVGLNPSSVDKLNFSILHWVKFLIEGWIKMMTKKKGVKQIRLKIIRFIILSTLFTNTDLVNSLKYHQLILNLIR